MISGHNRYVLESINIEQLQGGLTLSSRITPVVRTIALTKARNHLGDLVERVHHNKEYFILEKDGVPVVAIMDIDEFEDLSRTERPEGTARDKKKH